MPALCFQYFIVFAVFGCIGPYLSALLSNNYGLSDVQIGYVLGTGSFAVVITPVIITLLADTHVRARWLMMILYLVGAVTLGSLLMVDSFWPVLIAYCFYCLALVPTVPLQDGLTFAAQAQREREGLPELKYHRIRIWGSIGFMAPGAFLYFIMSSGASHRVTIIGGIICCVLGAINAFFLPDIRPGAAKDRPMRRAARMPTLGAAKMMLEPHVLVFALAMFLIQMAVAAYYTFYPRYLVSEAGIDIKWAGLVASIGVMVELPFILGFGWIMKKFGWKRLMVVGTACMVLRLLLLGLLPGATSALTSQVFHGLWVVIIHVAPPLFLNRFAKDEYRNSIQGLFAMIVYGGGRIIGNIVGGYVAEYDLTLVFTYGAALCAASLALFFFAFKDVDEPVVVPVVEDAPSEM